MQQNLIGEIFTKSTIVVYIEQYWISSTFSVVINIRFTHVPPLPLPSGRGRFFALYNHFRPIFSLSLPTFPRVA